jgi:SpoVK/Ycf46/Vps4 family AAA+-type ATPase
METTPTPPNFLKLTRLPDNSFESLGKVVVSAEYQLQRIESHMRICLVPESYLDWYRRFYTKEEISPKFKRAILLTGAPGTGKTTLAKVCSNDFAKTCATPACFAELGLVRSKFVGESSKNTKIAFDYIRGLAESFKVILFIDEFDSVGISRETEQMNEDISAMVNMLNQQMSSLDNSNIFIIACTNIEGRIDYATKRRFDFVFNFRRPLLKQRIAILEKLLGPYDISKDTVYKIAAKTQNYTPDDLTRAVNLAIEFAYLQNKPLYYWNLIHAIDEIKCTEDYS